jgi:pilus assembly protein CpaB
MQGTLVKQPGTERRTLIIALLLGAAAAGLIVAFLASQRSTTGGGIVNETTVVIAELDIPAGKVITAEDVALKSIPNSAILAGSYTDQSKVIGTTARYPVTKGEQIAESRLVSAAKGSSLSFQIPAGLRAFTVPVNVTNAPAAVLVPGDFVDVIFVASLASIEVPGAVLPPTTQGTASDPRSFSGVSTLIQNVQVLAVETNFVADGVYEPSTRGSGSGTKDAKYVTLAVTPAQAQLLWLAVQQGKLTLSLRAFGDDAIIPVAPVAEPVKP